MHISRNEEDWRRKEMTHEAKRNRGIDIFTQ
jgi:hypothetical protein